MDFAFDARYGNCTCFTCAGDDVMRNDGFSYFKVKSLPTARIQIFGSVLSKA